MINKRPLVAITGAKGYLGSRICEALESCGWQVARLGRTGDLGREKVLQYDLAMPIAEPARQAVCSADVLIHAAYDLSLRSAADIWRVNVEGTRCLLRVAAEANVARIIVLSSMSAFDGTQQLYGRAKLAIEASTIESGGCAVRPGLVYGEGSSGMAGALRQLTTLPVVPVIAGGLGLYTVREDDFTNAIVALASAASIQPVVISVAHPSRVALVDLLRRFAAEEDRRCRFVPVPWRLVYHLLRTAEIMRFNPPFRADSVLGLVHTAPDLSGVDELNDLGVQLNAFASDPRSIT